MGVMTKDKVIHAFWGSFGWKAYEETSVPDDAEMPRITHEGATDIFGQETAQTASLWVRSTDWTEITDKKNLIMSTISRGGKILHYDGGAVWIRMGTPFAQRMGESSDDMIRRIVINYTVEFID